MSRKNEYPDMPRVGVGAVVIEDGRVLLVRRGVPPSRGLWAIPGGGLNLGESLAQAAEREIQEETGIIIEAGEPIYSFDFIERDPDGRIRFHYVIIDLMAHYRSGEPQGADDALEARWFAPDEVLTVPISKNTVKLLRSIGFLGTGES